MQFQIDKWFGSASAVMWMRPVSCGDETAALEGKVLNISVNLRFDPHLQSNVGSGCKARVAKMSLILKVVGLSLRTSSEIQQALGRPMFLHVEKSYWKQIRG